MDHLDGSSDWGGEQLPVPMIELFAEVITYDGEQFRVAFERRPGTEERRFHGFMGNTFPKQAMTKYLCREYNLSTNLALELVDKSFLEMLRREAG